MRDDATGTSVLYRAVDWPLAIPGGTKVRPMLANTNSSSPPIAARAYGHCRLCDRRLETTFVDLGMSPLCESFLTADQINQMESYYPLHALVCGGCFLVQLQEYVRPEHIFGE